MYGEQKGKEGGKEEWDDRRETEIRGSKGGRESGKRRERKRVVIYVTILKEMQGVVRAL